MVDHIDRAHVDISDRRIAEAVVGAALETQPNGAGLADRRVIDDERVVDRARIVLAAADQSCGRNLYDLALTGGAQALGRDSGAIAADKWADMVALDPAALDDAPAGDLLLDQWIFAGDRNAVSDVWAAGRHVVKGGRHVARERIAARYRACLASIRSRL